MSFSACAQFQSRGEDVLNAFLGAALQVEVVDTEIPRRRMNGKRKLETAVPNLSLKNVENENEG